MCFACEVESVMECGKHRGSQRWQLTIIHLSFGERKLYIKGNVVYLRCFLGAMLPYNESLSGVLRFQHKDIIRELDKGKKSEFGHAVMYVLIIK